MSEQLKAPEKGIEHLWGLYVGNFKKILSVMIKSPFISFFFRNFFLAM